MTANQDIRHFDPYRPNRPSTVPATCLGFPMVGTHGTVGTVENEELLLLYKESYPVREILSSRRTDCPKCTRMTHKSAYPEM